MPRIINFEQKAEEFKIVLDKFGGMPKASQDKKAYALISYYIKNYSDVPEIRSLIEQYNLFDARLRRSRDTTKITKEAVISIIEKEGRIPSPKGNHVLYDKIKNFLKRNTSDPDLIRLKYKIADRSCFPLQNTKFGPNPGSGFDYASQTVSPEWIKWRSNTSFEFIGFVYDKYGEFPNYNTVPMEQFKRTIEEWYRYQREEDRFAIKDLLESLISRGCKEEWVILAYNSCIVDTQVLNDNVMKLLISNGACAIHYLAQVAVSSLPLPEEFVYWYYYIMMNDDCNARGIMPLGALYSYTGMQSQRVLRVHYREYNKCDINRIRESAKSHYRDWKKEKPVTLADWLYYGQSEFFANEEDFFYSAVLVGAKTTLNWDSSYIERNMREGIPYFRFYKNPPRYLDYCLFLLENGYALDTNYSEYDNIINLDENHPRIARLSQEDIKTFRKIKEIQGSIE